MRLQVWFALPPDSMLQFSNLLTLLDSHTIIMTCSATELVSIMSSIGPASRNSPYTLLQLLSSLIPNIRSKESIQHNSTKTFKIIMYVYMMISWNLSYLYIQAFMWSTLALTINTTSPTNILSSCTLSRFPKSMLVKRLPTSRSGARSTLRPFCKSLN